MRDFLTNPLAALAGLLALIALVFVFTGCKTQPQETTAHVAVVFATAKFIEKAGTIPEQQGRALRIITVLGQLDALVAGDETTVDALADLARSKLPADLSPADRVLANTLIAVATDELKARVGEGVGKIPPDAKIKVALVLSWVREGAESYAQPPVGT